MAGVGVSKLGGKGSKRGGFALKSDMKLGKATGMGKAKGQAKKSV